jgi:hypothetical protein
MPNRAIMRAKQKRAGSLGQSSRFFTLGGRSVAGASGFGKANPSVGSLTAKMNTVRNRTSNN